MYTVMIVDDEPLECSSIKKFIEIKFPYLKVIGIYHDSMIAYKAFQDKPADIVVTDIRMPMLDGLQLIEKLSSLPHYFVPIIVSGYNDFTYAKTAISLGVIHYLLKPIDFEELSATFEKALSKLQQHRHMSSHSILKDRQEIFFVDLISGHISSLQKIEECFNNLDFSFPLNESQGYYLRVSLMNTPIAYKYEKDTIQTAISNFVHILFRPLFCCVVYHSFSFYDLIIIRPQSPNFSNTMDEFRQQIKAILEIETMVEVMLNFENITELSINSHQVTSNNAKPGWLPNKESFKNQENDQESYKKQIQQAISYIKQHYAEDLTRAEVAEKVFMSSAHFSRCFKQETGMNFLDYLIEIRMNKALELLNTNMKIQDIGKLVGYPHRNRFIINFKNYTSYTPSEYRRDVLKMSTK